MTVTVIQRLSVFMSFNIALGAELFPVLREIIRWANKHIPGTSVPPASYLEKFEQQFAAAPRRKRTA